MNTDNQNLPLTPAVFHILLALSQKELHGYGIMKQVNIDSQGNVKMGAGTLYGSLKRMLDSGLVKEGSKQVDIEIDDRRRIYYQITGLGQKLLLAELERYKHLIEITKQHKPFPSSSSYGKLLSI